MSDPELIERAAAAMGWRVFAASSFRPGTRAVPFAWRWRVGGVPALMVYMGGKVNRRWDPLASEADAGELRDAAAAKGLAPGHDLATEGGRRALCEAAAAQLTGDE